MWWVLVALVLVGCGRINFDEVQPDAAIAGSRFYPREATAGPVSPARSSTWNADCGDVKLIDLTPSGEAFSLIAGCPGSGTNPNDSLFRIYVSPPLRAQTLGGNGNTIKGQFAVREGEGALDARAQVIAKVVSGDGTALRGVLFGPDVDALTQELNVSPTPYNRRFPRGVQPTNAVTAQDGDRLVFEIGYRIHSTDTGHRAFFQVGGNAASDLPEGGSTTSLNPWIELSDLVQF